MTDAPCRSQSSYFAQQPLTPQQEQSQRQSVQPQTPEKQQSQPASQHGQQPVVCSWQQGPEPLMQQAALLQQVPSQPQAAQLQLPSVQQAHPASQQSQQPAALSAGPVDVRPAPTAPTARRTTKTPAISFDMGTTSESAYGVNETRVRERGITHFPDVAPPGSACVGSCTA
jgi:hypothetical protein